MEAPDQGKGLISEREGRIKQCLNSNPSISLNHRSSPTNRSTVGINSTTKQVFSIVELENSFKCRASEDPPIIPDH
jgi:hypothetical protein